MKEKVITDQVRTLQSRGDYDAALEKTGALLEEQTRLQTVLSICGEVKHQLLRMQPALRAAGPGPQRDALEKEFSRLIATLEDATVEAARMDPIVFAEYVFGFNCAGFHRDWQNAYPSVAPLGLANLSTLHKWEVLAGFSRLILVAPRNHGKTLSSLSTILLSNGENVNVKKAFSSGTAEVIAYSTKNREFIPAKAKHTYTRIEPLFDIETSNGLRISTNGEHPFLQFFGWIPADCLKEGDFIALPKALPGIGKEKLPQGVAWAYGVMAGDGCFRRGTLDVTIGDHAVASAFERVMQKHGWYVSTVKIKGRKAWRISFKKASPFLSPDGFDCNLSSSRKFPERIYRCCDEDLAEYISGYLDTDAHVNPLRGGVVEFYSVSRPLLEGAQHLLMRLGIFSFLTPKKGKYKGEDHFSWRLIVRRNSDIQRMKEVLSPRGKRGPQIEAIESVSSSATKQAFDPIPPEWADVLRMKRGKLRREYGVYVEKIYPTGTHREKVIAAAIADDNPRLRELAEAPLNWVQIKSIKQEREGEIFGIEVEDHHTHVTNDIVTHNSTQIAEVRTLWELGRNPNILIKIVCASDDKAKDRVGFMRECIENPNDGAIGSRLRKVFPHLEPGEKWTKQALRVKRTIRSAHDSIEARGVMSTATGGRADLIIGDDVCDRRNTLLQPTLRGRVKEAWNDDWLNVLNPPGRVVFIATPWHDEDLTATLRRNPEYKTLFYRINEQLDPLWPERFSREELKKKRRQVGQIAFSRGYHCQPLTGHIQCIDPKWIQYYGQPPTFQANMAKNPDGSIQDELPEGRYAHFMGYDPASSEKDKADYTAAVVVSVHLDTLIGYVRHAEQFRKKFPEQVRYIRSMHQRWKFAQIAIEEVNYATSIRQQLGRGYPAIGVKPRENKQLRLQAVSPYIEAGLIRFDISMHPELYVRKDAEEVDLVTQLTRFPLARHDDLMDAFVYATGPAANFYLESKLHESPDDVIEASFIESKITVI